MVFHSHDMVYTTNEDQTPRLSQASTKIELLKQFFQVPSAFESAVQGSLVSDIGLLQLASFCSLVCGLYLEHASSGRQSHQRPKAKICWNSGNKFTTRPGRKAVATDDVVDTTSWQWPLQALNHSDTSVESVPFRRQPEVR